MGAMYEKLDLDTKRKKFPKCPRVWRVTWTRVSSSSIYTGNQSLVVAIEPQEALEKWEQAPDWRGEGEMFVEKVESVGLVIV